MKTKLKKLLTSGLAIIIVIAAALVLSTGFTTIKEGQVGVKSRFGKIVDTQLAAGPHFMVPFVDTIKKIDITQQSYLIDLTAYTKDTQTVDHMIIKVNYA